MFRFRVRFPALTRRTQLLLAVVVVLLAVGTVRAVYGSTAPSSPSHHAARAVHVACPQSVKHAHTGHHRTCPSRHRVVPKMQHVHRHVTQRRPITAARPRSALSMYAGSLLGVLGRSQPNFATAAQQARLVDGYDQLAAVCGWYANRVTVLTQQVDGVPHAGPWYTPVAYLHRQLLGVYHGMAGALESCRIAAGNGDDTGIATSREDLAATSRRMKSMVRYIRWLARRP